MTDTADEDFDHLQAAVMANPAAWADVFCSMAKVHHRIHAAVELARIAKSDPDGLRDAMAACDDGASVSRIVAAYRKGQTGTVTINLEMPDAPRPDIGALLDELNKQTRKETQ